MGFELLFKYMKGRRLLYVFTVTVFALNSAMGVVPAYFIGRLVDNVLLEGRKELFLGYAVIILSITLARSLVRYFSQLSVETTSQTVLYNLRRALYDKLQKLDNGFFSLNPVGDIMAQMTGDLDLARHTLAWIILVALECVESSYSALSCSFAPMSCSRSCFFCSSPLSYSLISSCLRP